MSTTKSNEEQLFIKELFLQAMLNLRADGTRITSEKIKELETLIADYNSVIEDNK